MESYITVAGTHGARVKNDWSMPSSDFTKNLKTLGYAPASEVHPFEWSTDLDGVVGKNTTWQYSGLSLYYYVVPPLHPEAQIPSDQTLIITFSHGAQVAFHAFALGMKGRLITVNPPVRSDMDAVIAKARPNIARWLNLYGDWKDVWAVLGAMRDGHFGIRRQFKQADTNILVPGEHGAPLTRKHDAEWAGWLREVMK